MFLLLFGRTILFLCQVVFGGPSLRKKYSVHGELHQKQIFRLIAPSLLGISLMGNQQAPVEGAAIESIEDTVTAEVEGALPEQVQPVSVETPIQKQKVIMEAGTRVTLFLDDELSSQVARPGDLFPVTVVEDVVADDIVVIPAGAKGFGEVRFAKKKGAFGRSGLLDVSLRHIELCDRDVAIRGRFRQEGKGNNAAVVATWVAVGVFSGFITGKRGIMVEGQEFKARTAEDIEAIECQLDQIGPEATIQSDTIAASDEMAAVTETDEILAEAQAPSDTPNATDQLEKPAGPAETDQQTLPETQGDNFS